jgi:hypothetical protein
VCRISLFYFQALSKIYEKRLLSSSCLSVPPFAWNNSAVTERIFVKFDIWLLFENVSRYFKLHYNLTRMIGTLHEDRCTFMVISRRILLKMKRFRTKIVEKMKTHILCSVTFFRNSCRLWYSMQEYSTARRATDSNIIRRMRFACWITKATDTHSEYVMLHFHGTSVYANTPQCYVIRTLSCFLKKMPPKMTLLLSTRREV